MSGLAEYAVLAIVSLWAVALLFILATCLLSPAIVLVLAYFDRQTIGLMPVAVLLFLAALVEILEYMERNHK